MSAVVPSAKPSRRRRRLFWGLAILLVLGGLPVGYFYLRGQADRDLEDAIAELDRVDPGWRLEDIEAKRRKVPEEKNSARIIVAAESALPPNRGDADVEEELARVPPPLLLSSDQEKGLGKVLEPLAKASLEARKLVHYPDGRYPLVYSRVFKNTLMPDHQKARAAAWLLQMEASLLAQKGRTEEAWELGRGILNSARSFGDEPTITACLIRLALATITIHTLERTLAKGQVSSSALSQMQGFLTQEADEDFFLNGMRGERAGTNQLFTDIEEGRFSVAVALGSALANPPAPTVGERTLDQLFQLNYIKRTHAAMLRYYTRAIEAARAKGFKKFEALQELQKEIGAIDKTIRERRELILVVLALPALMKTAEAELRTDTRLRCSIVALAAEQFRLRHQRWPTSLEELAKQKFLTEIPIDVFDGQPLRLRLTLDGLVIYSIGPEKKYNGTALDDLSKFGPNSQRLEFRLWNPDRRRQPPSAGPAEKQGQ